MKLQTARLLPLHVSAIYKYQYRKLGPFTWKQQILQLLACEQALSGVGSTEGKDERELVTMSQPLMLPSASSCLSCPNLANQRKPEMRINVNNIIILTNQHFASKFSMHIFKLLRHRWKLSLSPFPSQLPTPRESFQL